MTCAPCTLASPLVLHTFILQCDSVSEHKRQIQGKDDLDTLEPSGSLQTQQDHRVFQAHGGTERVHRSEDVSDVPYYWAGVFVLEAARFLYPRQHFGLVDTDCVPVTLFETQDLISLAESQFQWTDSVGHAPDEHSNKSKVGMLLFTEAHLEYNAGLVISIGSTGRPSPINQFSTAETLADDLADYRHQLLAMARPPENLRHRVGHCLLHSLERRWKTPWTSL